MKKFFLHPSIFDGLVSVLNQEMKKKAMRPHLCDVHARVKLIDQMVKKIRAGLGTHEIRTFAEICEAMPILKLELNKSNLRNLHEL